jgi:hypothetical protein
MVGDSTLGLGTLAEGADALFLGATVAYAQQGTRRPRNIRLALLPNTSGLCAPIVAARWLRVDWTQSGSAVEVER